MKAVISILLVIVLAVGGLVGWYVYSNHKAQVEAREQLRIEVERREAIADQQAEMRKQKESEMDSKPNVFGESDSFEHFFVEVKTTGVDTRNRFRFKATPSSADGITEICKSGRPGGTSCLPATADFDDPGQFKALVGRLVQKYDTACTVVVSLKGDGLVHINRADDCN